MFERVIRSDRNSFGFLHLGLEFVKLFVNYNEVVVYGLINDHDFFLSNPTVAYILAWIRIRLDVLRTRRHRYAADFVVSRWIWSPLCPIHVLRSMDTGTDFCGVRAS